MGVPKETTYQSVGVCNDDEESFRRRIVDFFMSRGYQVLKIVRDWNE